MTDAYNLGIPVATGGVGSQPYENKVPSDDAAANGPHPENEDLPQDGGWRQLLPALSQARNGRVLAFTQFRFISDIAAIPFDLHLTAPDAVQWLPLTADFTVIPFHPAILEIRSHRVQDALDAIRHARWIRNEQQRAVRDDFLWPDWEEGAKKHHSRFRDLALPPYSFVRIDRVVEKGETRSQPRPVLGRHSARKAPTPRVLVPGTGRLSPQAIDKLANTDLLLIDLQNIRGQRTLSMLVARSVNP
jgi:hypothetical protein